MTEYLTSEEYADAIKQALADANGGDIDPLAVLRELEERTGRTLPPPPPGYSGFMSVPLLTEAEIRALPADVQDHYRQHNHLRDYDDLVYFPAAKRETFERLLARGVVKTIARIRQQEGDEAADEAARQIEQARDDRARRVAELSRAS